MLPAVATSHDSWSFVGSSCGWVTQLRSRRVPMSTATVVVGTGPQSMMSWKSAMLPSGNSS